MIISITGFMGCGKSFVGRNAAKLASCQYIDLDSFIENYEHKSIREIFASNGEKFFRGLEEKALKEILSEDGTLILSLGGGTLTSPACAELIRSHTYCIYLKSSVGLLFKNLEEDGTTTRPMLNYGCTSNLEERIRTLLKDREPLYETAADMIIDMDKCGFDGAAKEIAKTAGMQIS